MKPDILSGGIRNSQNEYHKGDVIEIRPEGIYCPAGDFYIDPWKPVVKAVITHGHSDHARHGMAHYLTSRFNEPILKARLGKNISAECLDYGQAIHVKGVKVSLHPAGHIHGSAQIRMEHRGQITVITGDYKRQHDPTADSFEPVPCHTLVSECTFGLPVYRWPAPGSVFAEINNWWKLNAEAGRTSILFSYSLGKAQRLLSGLDPSIGPIWAHDAIVAMNDCYRHNGVKLPACAKLNAGAVRAAHGKGIVLAPPSSDESTWLSSLGDSSRSMASGWMQLRGRRRHRSLDRGFVLSDHVDWNGIIQTIQETGCEKVYLTHGYCGAVVRWLRDQGLHAEPLKTLFEGEADSRIPSQPATELNEERE
jgi:putative mRNA 3-end processing factor